jgi:hypothetical protein
VRDEPRSRARQGCRGRYAASKTRLLAMCGQGDRSAAAGLGARKLQPTAHCVGSRIGPVTHSGPVLSPNDCPAIGTSADIIAEQMGHDIAYEPGACQSRSVPLGRGQNWPVGRPRRPVLARTLGVGRRAATLPSAIRSALASSRRLPLIGLARPALPPRTSCSTGRRDCEYG